MKKELGIFILSLIMLFGCRTKKVVPFKSLFEGGNRQYYKEKDIQDYNCGGFIINKINETEKDSTYLNVNISSCIDGLAIPLATIWIKNQQTNQEEKFICDMQGNITIPLAFGYYSIRASAIHYNNVYTPKLILYPVNYSLKIYLGAGDPLID